MLTAKTQRTLDVIIFGFVISFLGFWLGFYLRSHNRS